jgi:hypothetical protein
MRISMTFHPFPVAHPVVVLVAFNVILTEQSMFNLLLPAIPEDSPAMVQTDLPESGGRTSL